LGQDALILEARTQRKSPSEKLTGKLTGKFTGNLTAETQRNAEKRRGKAHPRRSGDAPKNCRVRLSRTPKERKEKKKKKEKKERKRERKREKICSSVPRCHSGNDSCGFLIVVLLFLWFSLRFSAFSASLR
jgi:hypothetical protein